ncbi:MAG: restriction endonuclease subunit S [Pseudohongiellaceae bacterium]
MIEVDSKELPNGWRWVALADAVIADKQLVQPHTEEARKITYLSLEHIEPNSGRILKEPSEGPEDEGNSTTYRFTRKHVLYGKLRPYLNKVAEPDFEGRCTTELVPLLPKEGVDRRYLAFALRREEIVDAAMRGKTGARMPRANMDDLLKETIPLPPLQEQKRIAAILTERLVAVGRARKASKARIEAIRTLPTAYVREVFEGKRTKGSALPKGWRWVCMNEVCSINPRRPAIERNDSALTTFVPMEAIDGTTGSMDASGKRPYVEVNKGYTYFEEGDVVFSKITPCMQNGKHAVAHNLLDGMAFGTTEFHVLRPRQDVIADWIHLYLRCPEILHAAEQYFVGAVGQKRVPPSFLEALRIPLPSLQEQKRIATILTNRLATVEQARKVSQGQLSNINSLPASFIHQAFSGVL